MMMPSINVIPSMKLRKRGEKGEQLVTKLLLDSKYVYAQLDLHCEKFCFAAELSIANLFCQYD